MNRSTQGLGGPLIYKYTGLLAVLLLLCLYCIRYLPTGIGPSTALAAPGACTELLRNGDLEAPLNDENWRVGSTSAPGSVVGDPVHAGNNAIRLGIPANGTNRLTHSTLYQLVTIPATTQVLTLRYWERPGSIGDANDRRELLVLNDNYNVLAQISMERGSGDENWREVSAPLLDTLPNLPGETVVLYWNVYNDGSGSTLVNYLDDLSLIACDEIATPTPESTTVSPTPTPTPTVVSTPDPVRVRVGQVTVASGATTATVPLSVEVLTDRVTIGVLSANLRYDDTLLSATGCVARDGMELLLCNTQEPGLIQLAGVSATGLRGNTTVADLTFALLTNSDRTTPVTIEIKLAGDGDGTTIGSTPIDGVIDLSCSTETESCDRGNVIYLPEMHR